MTLVHDFVGLDRGDLSTAGMNVKCVNAPKQYRPQRLEQCVMRLFLFSQTVKYINFETKYISELIDIRQQSRIDKDFELSDKIRDFLDTKLTFVFDSKDGQEVLYLTEGYFKNMSKVEYNRNITFETKRKFVEWNIKEDIRLDKVIDAWVYSTLSGINI